MQYHAALNEVPYSCEVAQWAGFLRYLDLNILINWFTYVEVQYLDKLNSTEGLPKENTCSLSFFASWGPGVI